MKRLLKLIKKESDTEAPGIRSTTILDIEAARERIRTHIPITPVTSSHLLCEELGIEVYLKWDNKLRTGSFKERGALNFLLRMDSEQRGRGVCTVSAGNHAQGLSYHAMKLGINCHIVMPTTAPIVKAEACRKFGATVIQHGMNYNEGVEFGLRYAQEKNLVFVHPYDHADVIAGQGVAGLELLDELEDFDAVILPIGGGGYISGVATAIKTRRPEVFVLGASSEWAEHVRNSPASSGKVVTTSLADGIAVKTIGALTAPIIARYVDKLVAISENAIASGIVHFLKAERSVIEGAAAAAIAALCNRELPPTVKRAAIFISGSNIDINTLARLIERDMASQGKVLRVATVVPDRPGVLHEITGVIAKCGANILQVSHDRSYSEVPGEADVMWLLEVRNSTHRDEIVRELQRTGFRVKLPG